MSDILVIDSWYPRPDRDSASNRMVNLLALLQEIYSRVVFIPDDLSSSQSWVLPLERTGVEVVKSPQVDSVETYLATNGFLFDVVLLSRMPVAGKHIQAVRQTCPNAAVVFDTTDLHYLRGFRGAKVTGNASLLRQALHAKNEELSLVKAADCTLVVSRVEQEILERECPGAPVCRVSNIHPVQPPSVPYEDRQGIFFVGAFPHHPNVDAMEYYTRQISPLVKQHLPGVPITIIGSSPPPWLTNLNETDLVVTGYVKDLLPYLEGSRLSIAPLRYGAGVKGKVLQSMSHGLPVVATSPAVEGIPAVDGQDILISDDSDSFAFKMAQVYHDKNLWEQLSQNGMCVVSEHFSAQAARRGLDAMLKALNFSPRNTARIEQ